MIDINGMAHVILTVSRFDLARQFYGAVLPFMGMSKVFDGEGFVYWVGGRTALAGAAWPKSARRNRALIRACSSRGLKGLPR